MAKPDLAEVLAAVNALRAAYNIGRSLTAVPKGTPKSPTRCPLGRALKAAVVPNRHPNRHTKGEPYWQAERSAERPLPDVLAAFGVAFDAREYPELIEGTA